MPTCQSCGKDWSWKQTVKSSFTLDTGMKCPHCESKQYLTTKARRRSSIFPFIVPLLILLPLLFDLSISVMFSIFIVFYLVFIGIYPFLIELSNQEESLC